MEVFKLYIRFIIPAVLLLLLSQLKGYSQGTDLRGKQQHFYVGFHVGQAQTNIVNNGTSTITKLNSSKKNSLNGSIEIGYQFSKYFGLASGLGYSSYISSMSLETYRDSFNTTDSESETYNRRISGRNIEEIQKISFLNIPILASLHLPFGNNFGLYFETGINLSIPLIKEYISTGNFNYSGYYTAYKVLITDIPYEGFESNVKNDVGGELKIKSFIPEFVSSGGFQIFLTKKLQISAGVLYTQLLTDISGFSPSQSFQLSTRKDQVKSMMEGSSNVSASAMGFKVSFRYFFK